MINQDIFEATVDSIREMRDLMGDLAYALRLGNNADNREILAAVEALVADRDEAIDKAAALEHEVAWRIEQINDFVNQVDALIEERNALTERLADND